jgi:hypothetical protein
MRLQISRHFSAVLKPVGRVLIIVAAEPPLMPAASLKPQSDFGTVKGSVLQIRGDFEKDWKLFSTALVRFHSSLIAECSTLSAATGLCFRIVTIPTAVCNTNCPAFVGANFQAFIFSELTTDDWHCRLSD